MYDDEAEVELDVDDHDEIDDEIDEIMLIDVMQQLMVVDDDEVDNEKRDEIDAKELLYFVI